jgi:HEXXH motif-containing protein
VSLAAGEVRLTKATRLRAEAGGLVFDALLDRGDPYLARCGLRATSVDSDDVTAWQESLGEAWQILVRGDRPTASAMAEAITTIVPLKSSPGGLPTGATSGWAFGAVGLSLAPGPRACAEALVHEFQHVVLGGVMDLVPLTTATGGRRFYSPWREEPRPIEGLLQGCFAFFGVTAFWRVHRGFGSVNERRHADVSFARWRRGTLDAADTLALSDALTPPGRVLVEGMRHRLARWGAEPVGADAEREADRLLREHRRRWGERNAN